MRWSKWSAGKLATAVAGLVLLPVAVALLVAWSGIYNVAASRGHPAWLDWFLRLGMSRSVAFHSRHVGDGPAYRPGMEALGASHYHRGCEVCHGAPGIPIEPVLEHMLPTPPPLDDKVIEWTNQELFWIVRHGLQYTGMPAWSGAGRDDEIWPMVAFLRRLPQIDHEAYGRLTAGHAAISVAVSGTIGEPVDAGAINDCFRCHDTANSAPASTHTPRLAGQPVEYLQRSLREFRADQRQSGFMEPVALHLDDAEIDQRASFFSTLNSPRLPASMDADSGQLRRGAELAMHGDAARRIPACEACHGAGASANYPRLAGQSERYLQIQLALWQAGGRSDTPEGRLMAEIGQRLDAADIVAVAGYYQNIEPFSGSRLSQHRRTAAP
jgi:cytochrome c553